MADLSKEQAEELRRWTQYAISCEPKLQENPFRLAYRYAFTKHKESIEYWPEPVLYWLLSMISQSTHKGDGIRARNLIVDLAVRQWRADQAEWLESERVRQRKRKWAKYRRLMGYDDDVEGMPS